MSFTISNIRLKFMYYLETNNTSPTLEELNLAGWSPMYKERNIVHQGSLFPISEKTRSLFLKSKDHLFFSRKAVDLCTL